MKYYITSVLPCAIALCALLFFGVMQLCADVPVCQKCGYENSGGQLNCRHCKSKLPDWTPKPTAGDAGKGPHKAAWVETYLDGQYVEEEIQLAGSYASEGKVEMARLFARNSMALDLLTKRGLEPERAGKIANFLERCRTRTLRVPRKCRECDGTGKLYRKTLSIGAESKRKEVLGRKCAMCGGAGMVNAYGTVNERKFRMGRAMRTYATVQQGRQYVAVGNAWLPPSIKETLSARQKAALLSSVAAPCEDCMGIGRLDCKDCQGVGTVKCTYKYCVDGISQKSEKGQIVKGSMTRSKRCTVCEGAAVLECEDCRGKGSLLCDECSGMGERSVCKKCSGQGVAPCRRCKGSGSYKGASCDECKTEGQTLCRSCDGDGRK